MNDAAREHLQQLCFYFGSIGSIAVEEREAAFGNDAGANSDPSWAPQGGAELLKEGLIEMRGTCIRLTQKGAAWCKDNPQPEQNP
jgi:hypothetical protein